MRIAAWATAFLFCLAGCASPVVRTGALDKTAAALETERQNKLALESLLNHYKRLYQVSYPILKANRDLCDKNQIADLKVLMYYGHQLPKEYEAVAASLGIERTNAEIAEKRAQAKPLTPNLKEVPVVTPEKKQSSGAAF